MGKYVDIPACMQVIGDVYQNPALLDNEGYTFNLEDFTEDIHKVIFSSIYNLHQLGAKEINPSTIEDYLGQRTKMLGIYRANNGAEYLQKLSSTTQLAAFDYYYKRMKKMTLLRMYQEQAGMNLSWLYDTDNIFDQKRNKPKKIGQIIPQQNKLLNKSTLELSVLKQNMLITQMIVLFKPETERMI